MVRFGQTSQHTAGSASASRLARIGTSTLRELSTDSGPRRPALLDHHLLLLVTVGHGSYEVDFQTYQCRPGTLILARPGQLVRTDAPGGWDAAVVCWSDDTLDRLTPGSYPLGPTHWQLAGEDQDAVINEVSQLVVDCQRHRGRQLATDLLRHQLAVLLLRLALLPSGTPASPVAPAAEAPDPATAAEDGTYQRLCREIEAHFQHTRRVEDYAARLGCSVRTLTRACLAETGRSAKQLVDDRVALQARRLLAATDEPIAEIGRRLGFPEPTNFGRFFQREVGQSPGAFRTGLGRPVVPTGDGAEPAETTGNGIGGSDRPTVTPRVPGQRPVGPQLLLGAPPHASVPG
ncbi:AraC family transcriptional regulator [Micromonospora pisi]|uniref:AraC family transcriptional regulator n=1 Tax=Micromonospora pisi TaxID=589240 RepID=A0A495JQB3_9ACTN|nr:AraC family transcriptional regulator [Micromonospora pisi]RKR91180.1 AraC family transcriptional regulator [Micromonospora pisi]